MRKVRYFVIGVSKRTSNINANEHWTVSKLADEICKKASLVSIRLGQDRIAVYAVSRSDYETRHNDLRGLIRDMTALDADLTVSNRFDDAICVIAPELLQIHYYVLGTDQPPRTIQIEFGAEVDTLIRLICNDSRNLRGASLNTDANTLDFPELNHRLVRLFKADENIFTQPATVRQTNFAVDNSLLLLPGTDVAKYLADPRKLELYVLVHELTIVARPSTKRKAEDNRSTHQATKKPRQDSEDISQFTTQPPPSVLAAKPSTTQSTSRAESPVLYNGRPPEHTGPPIFIYHPIFAKFIHKIRDSETETESTPPNPHHLRRTSQFTTKLLTHYTSKSTRCASYAQSAPFTHPDIRTNVFRQVTVHVNGKDVSPDGSISTLVPIGKTEEIDAYVLFTEVSEDSDSDLDEEFGDTETDPVIRAQTYHRNLYSSPEYEPIRKHSCCPSFLLILTPHLCLIYGAILADHPIYQLLIQPIAFGPDYTTQAQGEDYWSVGVKKLAHVFRVLEECVDDLRGYYRGLVVCRNPDTRTGDGDELSHGFCPPHFTQFPPTNPTHRLEYIDRISSHNPQKAIFKAHLINNSDREGTIPSSTVVVKFIPTYNPDAHKLLADKGLAPRVWFCERVESVGGLWVVVMDYIRVDTRNIREYHEPGVVKSLRTAIKLLHDRNLVFGDLREGNVLIPTPYHDDDAKKKEKENAHERNVMLIDFDWCAPHDVGRYVYNLNPDIPWAPGVSDGDVMKVEHDAWMFERLTGEML